MRRAEWTTDLKQMAGDAGARPFRIAVRQCRRCAREWPARLEACTACAAALGDAREVRCARLVPLAVDHGIEVRGGIALGGIGGALGSHAVERLAERLALAASSERWLVVGEVARLLQSGFEFSGVGVVPRSIACASRADARDADRGRRATGLLSLDGQPAACAVELIETAALAGLAGAPVGGLQRAAQQAAMALGNPSAVALLETHDVDQARRLFLHWDT